MENFIRHQWYFILLFVVLVPFSLSFAGDSTYVTFKNLEKKQADQNVDQLIEELNKCIKIKPTDFKYLLARGLAFALRGEYSKSLHDFTLANAMDAKNPAILTGRGKTLEELGRCREAVADFSQAIEVENTNVMALEGLGACYVKLSNYHDAEKYLSKALEIVPNSGTLLARRGVVWSVLGKSEKAEDDLAQALALDDHNWSIFLARSETRRIAANYAGAVADASEAIRLSPGNAKAYRARGDAYFDMGDKENATVDYRAALQQDPEHGDAYRGLAWIMATTTADNDENRQEAVRLAKQAISLSPESPANNEVLAAAYAGTGDFASAVEVQEKAISLALARESKTYLERAYMRLEQYKGHILWWK